MYRFNRMDWAKSSFPTRHVAFNSECQSFYMLSCHHEQHRFFSYNRFVTPQLALNKRPSLQLLSELSIRQMYTSQCIIICTIIVLPISLISANLPESFITQ